MKRLLSLLFAGALMIVLGVACGEKGDPVDKPPVEPKPEPELPEDDGIFYYYGSQKIYLTQVKEKIYVKYSSEAEKPFELIENSNEPLEYFKAMPKVVSANYLLQYRGPGLIAITDEITVKLKATTTYTQLQKLAGQNNCRIGEEDEFVKNQYMLYVSKTSDRGTMQTANLFHETGLFEFSEPNLVDLIYGVDLPVPLN